jgi:hypothetical protein
MKIPSESIVAAGGGYMPLEVELVYAGNAVVSAGALSGNHVAFATYRFSGDTDGDFDDNGFFYTVTGLTAGAAHVLSTNSQSLKVGIGTGTTRYLVLSQTEDSLKLDSVTGYAIDIQTSGQFRMGIQGTGIPTATATPFAMEIHSETNASAVLTAGDTGLSCGIRNRYEISKAQTNQISLCAMDSRLRVKANIADGAHAGMNAGVEADGAITFTGTSTTQMAGVHAYIELGSTCVFTNASGYVTGVTIDSSIHATQTDIANVTLAGLRIKKSSGKLAWAHGIYIDASAATAGITIGTCAGAGIDFPSGGTYAAALRYGTFTTPVLFGDDEPFEIHGRLDADAKTKPLMRVRCSTPDGTAMTTGEVHAIQAQAYNTSTSDAAVLEALQGHVGIKAHAEVIADIEGEEPNMRACWLKIEDLGYNLTLTGTACVLNLGMQWNTDTTLTGNCDWIKLVKKGSLTDPADAIIRIYDGAGGGAANYLMDGPASVPFTNDSVATNSGASQACLKVKFGGTVYEIPLFTV